MVDKFSTPKVQTDDYAKRLYDAMECSQKAIEPFLKFREKAMRVSAGGHYGSTPGKRMPINKMSQGVKTYSRLLSSRNPAFKLSTDDSTRRWVAELFRTHIQDALKNIKFKKTMQDVIQDAIYLFGVTKTGIATSDEVWEYEDSLLDLQDPYIKRVSPDHFLPDMSARSWEAMHWCADLVEEDYQYMMESGLYKNTDQLRQVGNDEDRNQDGAAGLSRDSGIHDNVLYPRTRVWKVYVPRERIIITLPYHGGKALRYQDYYGPEGGPYHILEFERMTDNLMPVSMAMQWFDLNDLANKLVRKMMHQAERQKTFGLVQKGSARSGKTILNDSQDGGIYAVDNPNGAQEMSIGGVNEKNFGFLSWSLGQLNNAQNNLELLSGTAAQADTARQEEMLAQRSNVTVQDMHDIIKDFMEDNMRDLVWYERTEPIRVRAQQVRVNGVDVEATDWLTPSMLEHDYSLEIEPYSMMPRSPNEDLNLLKSILGEVVMPLMPNFQQQGITLDSEELLRFVGEKSDLKELGELFTTLTGEAMEGAAPGLKPAKAAHTKREYVRRNVSASTQQGAEAQLVEAMSQMNALG